MKFKQIHVLGILFVFLLSGCATTAGMNDVNIDVVDEEETWYDGEKSFDQDTAFIDDAQGAAQRTPYRPITGCAPSRLERNDIAMVTLGGGPNGIRSYPDTHPSDNIIYRAQPGELMRIIGGPECSYGWLLWQVEVYGNNVVGWTPESNGDEFWLERHLK